MEDPGLNININIDNESLFQMAIRLPINDLLSLCQTNIRMSIFCRTDRLWRTRLTRDFPGVDYHDVADTTIHAYIALHAARKLIDRCTLVIDRPGAYLKVAAMVAPAAATRLEIKVGGDDLTEGARTLWRAYGTELVPAPLIYGMGPRRHTYELNVNLDRNVVTIGTALANLIKTLGLDYTDIKIECYKSDSSDEFASMYFHQMGTNPFFA
jgi:hypothetical protein